MENHTRPKRMGKGRPVCQLCPQLGVLVKKIAKIQHFFHPRNRVSDLCPPNKVFWFFVFLQLSSSRQGFWLEPELIRSHIEQFGPDKEHHYLDQEGRKTGVEKNRREIRWSFPFKKLRRRGVLSQLVFVGGPYFRFPRRARSPGWGRGDV